jgi:aspartate carbamoyltransferase
MGSVSKAAGVSPVPVINAGDGAGEHPTQALLDLFTIRNEMGKTDGLQVCFVGDLANGRTVHSLLKLLSLYPNNRFHLVSPARLGIERHPLYEKVSRNIGEIFHVRNNLWEAKNILEASDVIYMTRVQKERFTVVDEYAEVKDSCLLTPELVSTMKPGARILHPLPRVNELPVEIDSDPRAAYFRQVRSGLLVRMSLLIHTLK